jgi:hypothetical protein
MPVEREAILAGGPLHGKRLAVSAQQYVTAAAADFSWLALASAPRPSFWRHPLAWRRWQPPPPLSEPTYTQYSYRAAGHLTDGTPVYWFAGPDIQPPAASDDVLRHLYQTAAQVSPARRHAPGMHWVMGPEWYAAVRRVPSTVTWDMDNQLLGIPVKVSHGAPRLTAVDDPQ